MVIFKILWHIITWLNSYGLLWQGLQKFYENVMQGILRHVNFDVVKCVLIASPGFVRDQFFEFMIQEAIKTDNKLLLDNKSKFLLVHSSSGFKHSLRGNKVYICILCIVSLHHYTYLQLEFKIITIIELVKEARTCLGLPQD